MFHVKHPLHNAPPGAAEGRSLAGWKCQGDCALSWISVGSVRTCELPILSSLSGGSRPNHGRMKCCGAPGLEVIVRMVARLCEDESRPSLGPGHNEVAEPGALGLGLSEPGRHDAGVTRVERAPSPRALCTKTVLGGCCGNCLWITMWTMTHVAGEAYRSFELRGGRLWTGCDAHWFRR